MRKPTIKMKTKFALLFFILFSSSSYSVNETYNWRLEKNEIGIKVYSRPMKGFDFREVRVVNKVKSTLAAIVAVILDTKNYPKWVYGCSSTATLKILNDQEIYNYQVTDLPWPLSDRDVVSHFKVTQDPITKVVTFSKTGMADYIPDAEGMVRVQNFQSITVLTPLAGDSVLIELEMHLDASGNIPDWVVNENMVAAPFNSTVSMIKRIPLYQAAYYYFIKEDLE